jgi:hypothetical protein
MADQWVRISCDKDEQYVHMPALLDGGKPDYEGQQTFVVSAELMDTYLAAQKVVTLLRKQLVEACKKQGEVE